MKRFLRFSFVGLLASMGCDELIVKDISNQTIEVLAPSQQVVLTSGAVRFLWEEFEFADHYRLTLVSPAFSNMERTVADTLLEGSGFTLMEPLVSGAYEWRIQAFNAEYQTRAQTYAFRVQTTKDIGAETMTLLAPHVDAALTSGQVAFSWDAVPGAENYRLWVASPNFDRPQQILADEMLAETHFQLELPDGEYQWRVQALNAEYRTEPQTSSFRITTFPDIGQKRVVVVSPQAGAEIAQEEVAFAWENVKGATTYRLRIVSPSFDDIQWLAEDITLEGTLYRLALPQGTYQWQIQALNEVHQTAAQTYSFRRVSVSIDLRNKQLQVIAPSPGITLRNNPVTFAWEPLSGAEHYRLTLVSPSFERVEKLFEDTTLAETIFHRELPDGDYQWRIQALNEGSQTTPQVFSFQTSSLIDIRTKTVAVIAPSPGVTTTSQSILFAWEPVFGATKYRLMIASPSFNQVEILHEDTTTEQTSFRASLPAGVYQWRIQALNEQYQTAPQTYNLTIAEPAAVP